MDAVINRYNKLANKIYQIERDAATVYAVYKYIQTIDLKFGVAEKRLSEKQIYLENLNLFLDKLRDIVIKIIKAAAPYLNLKSSVLSNFVCRSFENIDRNS